MNAYDVLRDHHDVLRGLCRQVGAVPAGTPERQHLLDELLVEFDIHMRIEDDLYYPAMAALGPLIAIAHAQHRQIYDQLAVLLRTPPSADNYDAEWRFFVKVLEAHADEEERDMVPPAPPFTISDADLEKLGNRMVARMERLRSSLTHKLRVKARTAVLSAL